MTRRTAAAALALVLAVAAGCGDGDDAGDEPTTTSTPAGTSAPTTVPATVPATEPTVPGAGDGEGDGPGIPTDPAAYATALVEAWATGDTATARVLATQEAVDALFAYDPGGPGLWQLEGCEGAAGSSYCTFRAGGDPTVVVRVGNEAAAHASPEAVTEVRVSG